MSKTVIGLTGLARAGKDTCCQLLIEELAKKGKSAKRFALADKLKADLQEFILSNYGIDVLTCGPEEKTQIREFLVFHGKMKRITSQGRYWTSLLRNLIENDTCDVAIVTDVRYDIFPEDELHWLKKEMGGPLVHIARFEWVRGWCQDCPPEMLDGNGNWKHYIQPPNADEALNDPRIKAKADYHLDWATGDTELYCRPAVVDLLGKLVSSGRILL